ncbi:MAG: hypothetical protein ACE5IL_07810 [Myxococcota bacterium]
MRRAIDSRLGAVERVATLRVRDPRLEEAPRPAAAAERAPDPAFFRAALADDVFFRTGFLRDAFFRADPDLPRVATFFRDLAELARPRSAIASSPGYLSLRV